MSKSEKAEMERLKSWQFLHICVLRDYLHLEFQVQDPSFHMPCAFAISMSNAGSSTWLLPHPSGILTPFFIHPHPA